MSVGRADAEPAALEGRVVSHDVRDAGGKVALEKGRVLDSAAAARLLTLPWREIHLIELEPGDIHEEAAGARLSQASAGEGVEVKGYGGGQWTLGEVNDQEGLAVYTLYDLQPVEAGETVARAKISPLVIAESLVKGAEERAWASSGLVTVKPFKPWLIGALAPARLEHGQRVRFEAALSEKVDWLGSRLLPVRYPDDVPATVASTLEGLAAAGAELVIAAGASSLDPLDSIFGGLRKVGGRMVRHGVPAHPGSLLWLAGWRGRPVLGMPACGMFSQATVFDLVLPRILAGEEIGGRDLARLGHGGLLSRDSAWRFPPYRPSAARGELPE